MVQTRLRLRRIYSPVSVPLCSFPRGSYYTSPGQCLLSASFDLGRTRVRPSPKLDNRNVRFDESVSCSGCHDRRPTVTPVRSSGVTEPRRQRAGGLRGRRGELNLPTISPVPFVLDLPPTSLSRNWISPVKSPLLLLGGEAGRLTVYPERTTVDALSYAVALSATAKTVAPTMTITHSIARPRLLTVTSRVGRLDRGDHHTIRR